MSRLVQNDLRPIVGTSKKMSDKEWVTEFWRLLKQDRWDECWPLLEAHYGEAEAWYLIGMCTTDFLDRCFLGPKFWCKAAEMGHAIACAICFYMHPTSLSSRQWLKTAIASRDPLVRGIMNRSVPMYDPRDTPDRVYLYYYFARDGVLAPLHIAIDGGLPSAMEAMLLANPQHIDSYCKRPQFISQPFSQRLVCDIYYERPVVKNWRKAAEIMVTYQLENMLHHRCNEALTISQADANQRLVETLVLGRAMTEGRTSGLIVDNFVVTYNHFRYTSVAILSLTHLSLGRDLCQFICEIMWERVKNE